MPRYDAVLLDADNTLFDFDAAERAALRLAMESLGLPLAPDTERLYREINRRLWAACDRGEITQSFLLVERFRLLLERLGGGHDPEACNDRYLAYLGRESRLLPGAEELCRDLHAAGLRLAVATNGVARVQRSRLEGSALLPLLSGVFISEELGARKPDPAFFDRALEGLNLTDRSRCVMVGDGLLSDIRGGRAAGLDTIWYNPGGLPAGPHDIPTHIASSLEDVRLLILSQ